MLWRLWLGVVCVVSVGFALNPEPVSKKIAEVNGKTLIFEANGLKVGQSGIVLAQNGDYNVIIASAVIERIESGNAYARFAPFENIAQKYLPTPQATPTKDDKVIFGGFYNKAIAIAPDQESYNKILSTNPTHFVHIDLFAAFLAKDGINDPKPKHLREFCNAYSIGLVYIVASNGLNVLDCQSFALLEVQPFSKPLLEKTQAPFFSRIVNIDTGSLASKMRPKKSRQYFKYYDELLSPSIQVFNATNKE